MDSTNEFFFILKPSEHGIGVFAVHDIKVGTYLRLFKQNDDPLVAILRLKKAVPKIFTQYCLDRGDDLMCPSDFGHMEIGWYLNHSKMPNAYHKNYNYYSSSNIKTGDEITIDYNSLEELDETRDDYYKN